MKRQFLSIITILLVVLMAGCKKDNFKEPTSMLQGRVVFQNQALGLRSDGVQLELWQPGYQLFTKIQVFVAQDGTFSASLFDGNYKLTRLRGNGPWADNTDTINVTVRGNTMVDVPVDPFFILKNETFQKSGTNVAGTVNLQQVNTSRNLEYVRIYLGQTIITDQTNNLATATVNASAITDLSQPVNLSVAIPASLASKDYAFVRIGVKTAGVAELLYTQPRKIQLK
jgi:hypothetical protein